MTTELEPGEVVRLEGRAGYETPINRGNLTLTNRRLIWERSFSIDPFGQHKLSMSLGSIRGCESRGDAIVLDTEKGDVFLFVQWWVLSVVTGSRRTKEWLREISRAIAEARAATPAG